MSLPRKFIFLTLILSAGLVAWLYPVVIDTARSLKNSFFTPRSFIPVEVKNIDTNEFAPGHPQPSRTALEQIQAAPSPRFRTGHDLLPNVLWMSPRYFGGLGNGANEKQVIENSTGIMLSLAQRMNYYLVLPGTSYGLSGYDNPNTVAGAYIRLANDNPELPASVITFWGNANGSSCGIKPGRPNILRTDLPDSYYIQAGTRKRISPSAPVDSFINDGLIMRCYFEKLCKNLRRPVQYISENGEVFKLFGKSVLEDDPQAIADKNASGISDWNEYEATRRLEKEIAVQKGFLDLPCFKNVIYTEYGIDGQKTYRHKYSVIRKVNSRINGQYYSTPDFYPRWPNNWKNWKGAWHGFKWIAECRTVEIPLGDRFYSPFVSAGWDHREENNIRPAQWLGLLKILGVTGAEFYHAGFFSLQKPFPKPEHYAWQALMPAYAQAVTSRYNELFRNSELLNLPSINLSKVPDELVAARKHKDKEVYVISGTIQPSSNEAGSSPLKRVTSVTVGSHKLSFEIRRQGSTYVFDATGSSPVFYQLDAWHEYKHPSRWEKKVFEIEAEVTERMLLSGAIQTEAKGGNDYSDYISYVRLNEGLNLDYTIDPKDSVGSARALVRGKGKLVVSFGSNQTSISVNEKSWKWIDLKFNKGSKDLQLSGYGVEIDKLQILPTR